MDDSVIVMSAIRDIATQEGRVAVNGPARIGRTRSSSSTPMPDRAANSQTESCSVIRGWNCSAENRIPAAATLPRQSIPNTAARFAPIHACAPMGAVSSCSAAPRRSEFPVEISLSPLETGEGSCPAAIRDISEPQADRA